MDKKKIRAEITALRRMMSDYDTAYLSGRIKKAVCSLDLYRACNVLFAYISYNNEVQTRPIIEQALADKKKVAVPRIPDKKHLVFHYIHSLEDLQIGYGGMFEPKYEEPAPDESALLILPGLAFDYDLNRIGDGGGFYDRYLANHKSMDLTKMALAYDFQIYKHLDVIEEHDERLDLIVTPTMIIS